MKNLLKLLLLVSASLFIVSMAWGEEPKKESFQAVIGSDGIQRVEVLGGGYFFKPNHIIVKVNVPVEMTVKKESGFVPHDIEVKAPEAGIDFKIALEDQPSIIKFTPTKAGKYPFVCTKKLLFFKSHKDKGMEGMLEVVE